MRIESQLLHYHLVILSLAEIQIQAFCLLKLVMIAYAGIAGLEIEYR